MKSKTKALQRPHTALALTSSDTSDGGRLTRQFLSGVSEISAIEAAFLEVGAMPEAVMMCQALRCSVNPCERLLSC